jgi:exonuclease V gamma subunit
MPFIPEISWTYADLRGKGKSEEDSLTAAIRKWQGNDFTKGAKDDPYYALCFRDADPLNGNNSRAFCDLALEVFEPLRASLESGGSDS